MEIKDNRGKPAMDETLQRFIVETPAGIVTAVESPDKNNPGIVLTFIGRDGTELSSCSMQYMEEKERVETRVWSKDDPDGEPVAETGFDAHMVKLDIVWPGSEPVEMFRTVAEFEIALQDGRIGLDWEISSAWVGDTEIAASTFEDVAEYLRQYYDFTY